LLRYEHKNVGIVNRFRVANWLPKKLEEMGVPPAAILRHAGLSMGFFHQEKMLVDTEEFFALWRSISEVSRDPLIGLKLGTEDRIERYDPISIAVLHSRSLRDAVERMSRYKQLTCPEKIQVNEQRQESTVQFKWVLAKESEPSVLIDLCFARVVAIGRRGTGIGLRPIRIELERSSANADKYEKHFGCPVKFKAKHNRLIFKREDFDRPFVTHDPELLGILLPHLDAELRDQLSKQTIGEQVKGILKRLVAGQRPAIEDLARELNMSARTLQRRLSNDGVTFQQLLEQARRELAHHYLLHSSLGLTEAAYLLGFENSNSFFRAFHSWEGVSPARWRAVHATSK
jgi:AraC-like DNA-binding protein